MTTQMMTAVDTALASGQMTQSQRDELVKVMAIDWKQILSLLPLIATFFPALGPIIPLITPIVTVILNLINNIPNVIPGPVPPVVIPDGGGPPNPH